MAVSSLALHKTKEGMHIRFLVFFGKNIAMKSVLFILVSTMLIAVEATVETTTSSSANNSKNDESNPPLWPTDGSVVFLHPSDSTKNPESSSHAKLLLQDIQQDPWNEQHQTHTSDLHFSSRRQVVLVEPGVYNNVTFQVGYYTQVMGLGKTPDEVLFQNGGPYVTALNKHLHHGVGTSLGM